MLFTACGFDDVKMNLLIGVGFIFMEQHKNEFDAITSDTSDPVGTIHALVMFNRM